MAHILSKVGNRSNIPYKVFYCDDEADLNEIDVSSATMGSKCYVINDGVWYILNSKKEWKKDRSGDSPDSPDTPVTPPTPEDDEIIYDGGEEV